VKDASAESMKDRVAPPGGGATTPDLEVQGLCKHFGSVVAVDSIDFTVDSGEFVSILGPSGCGKTTTLRMVAGLEEVTAGRIFIRGRDVTHLPPEKRNTAMVFQSYALFPHMNVHDNVAFGLKMRGVAKAEIDDRVAMAMRRVRLEGYEKRKPSQLSGGQRQRVAVARAIIVEPAILLLDEALTNLDRRLRQQLQLELKELQVELGITSLFVTHDQEEALTMSDRIIVMDEGLIAQNAEPSEVYDRPASAFVAGFIGESNRLDGSVVAAGDEACTIRTDAGLDLVGVHAGHVGHVAHVGRQCAVMVRPRAITLHAERPAKDNVIEGVVKLWAYKGESYEYVVTLPGGGDLLVSLPRREAVFERGDRVFAAFDARDVIVVERG